MNNPSLRSGLGLVFGCLGAFAAIWGAGGEQIDMRSGNLNFTLTLVKAMGRGAWGVGFSLNYNSQL